MTYVEVVKNCLDKGIYTKQGVYLKLKIAFPQDNEFKLWHKVEPTINYLNSKRIKVNKKRFRDLRLSLRGTAKTQLQQNLLEEYLKVIRERTTLKLPETIYWTNSYRRSYAQKRMTFGSTTYRIKLSKNVSDNRLLGVLLHELVHINGHYNHKRGFYKRLIEVGKQCQLPLVEWFKNEYTRGRRYYEEISCRKLS